MLTASPIAAVCPKCHGIARSATTIACRPPAAGDLIVCLACGTLCVFTEERSLRELALGEMAEYPPDLLHRAINLSAAILGHNIRQQRES